MLQAPNFDKGIAPKEASSLQRLETPPYPISQPLEKRVFRVLSAAKELSDPHLQPLEKPARLAASYSIQETISNVPKSLKTLVGTPLLIVTKRAFCVLSVAKDPSQNLSEEKAKANKRRTIMWPCFRHLATGPFNFHPSTFNLFNPNSLLKNPNPPSFRGAKRRGIPLSLASFEERFLASLGTTQLRSILQQPAKPSTGLTTASLSLTRNRQVPERPSKMKGLSLRKAASTSNSGES